ncbi:MAG: SIR2 family protein [Oscillospiraceae bacterium]|nr:SIR2 family protein [Oscillospiraceae bacterium]
MATKAELNSLKEPLNRIIGHIRNYDAILWAGSGLSIYAGYPNSETLCKKIIESAETEKAKDILKKRENSLMELSKEFSQIYKSEKLVEILKSNFDVPPSVEPITHKLIAKIPQINTIITTNYDHLFEIAYGDNITVCVGTSFNKTERNKIDLYKIHGDTSQPDSIVITTKDYVQFYEKQNTILWGKLKWILTEKFVIFIGYSLEDENIQDIFENIISQIGSKDKELFIVTPELLDYKLAYLNKICKTTHIPLSGEEFIEYIESEIRRNIVLDAAAKKISFDEAYKICWDHGITLKTRNEPNGPISKLVVESIGLSPEVLFNSSFLPFGRGLNISSNPATYEAMQNFFNDCDCRELVIPAEDAVLFQDINGIYIPETHKINGRFPDVVKLEKKEIVERLNLIFEENNALNCVVHIRAFWGNIKCKMTIEFNSIIISIQLLNNKIENISLSYRYPHSVDNAIADLKRLRTWADGADMVFQTNTKQTIFDLKGVKKKDNEGKNENTDELGGFINGNIILYDNLKKIELDLNDTFIIDKEITQSDLDNIARAEASLAPQILPCTYVIAVNSDNLTKKQFKFYSDNPQYLRATVEEDQIIPEDYIELLGKKMVLGRRKVTLVQPYIKNSNEVLDAIENGQSITIEVASKTNKAILEYLQK